MKKIFSKFTKERAEEFQIETAIWMDGGRKFAAKHPLSDKAKAHVAALYENYQYFCGNGIRLFAECAPFENGVRFEFVDGQTYYSLLLEAVESGDKERFDVILQKYMEIVEMSCVGEGEAFALTPEFEAVFGSRPQLAGKKACRKLDIDLTLDNLILTKDGGNKVIDYEWIFDFPVPVDFMYYRAALALCVRNGAGLKSFISEKELYGKFGLTENDREIYREMNEAFNAYTTGGPAALSHTLKKYAKKSVSLSEWARDSYGLVQVFISKDAAFHTAHCLDYVLNAGERADLVIELTEEKDVKVIRLDPLNTEGCISDFRMTYTESGAEQEIDPAALRHNALLAFDGKYVFTGRILRLYGIFRRIKSRKASTFPTTSASPVTV